MDANTGTEISAEAKDQGKVTEVAIDGADESVVKYSISQAIETMDDVKEEFIEHPTVKMPDIRPRTDTQSSLPDEDRSCSNCGQLGQIVESAMTMIQDMLDQYVFLTL